MELSKLASKFKSLAYYRDKALPQVNDAAVREKLLNTIKEYSESLKRLMVLSRSLPKEQDTFEQVMAKIPDLERELRSLELESRLDGRCT